MAGNSRPTQWLTSLAAGTLATLATFFVWHAGADRAASKHDQSYLDRASAAAAKPVLKPTITVTPPAATAAAPASPAKLPRATGVANGSYNTKIDGATFVFGAPSSSPTKFEVRFGPVVVRSGADLLSGGNIGDYDVANGGFEAQRGAVAERYMYDTNRVEQLVVIPDAPAGKGAITVNSPVTVPTGQKVEPRGGGWVDPVFMGGGLAFVDTDGKDIGGVYGARVVDADGRQMALRPTWTGSSVSITVPQEFVACAKFPLTVDPWIDFGGSGSSPGIPVGGPGTAITDLSSNCTFGPANEPIYTWTDGGNIYLLIYNAGTASWVALGPSASGGTGASLGAGAFDHDVCCPSTGLNPIIAFRSTGNEIFVRRWDGLAWAEMGLGSATGGGLSATASSSSRPRIALDSTDVPAVVWDDNGTGVPAEIFVKKFVGGAYVPVAAGLNVSGTPGTDSVEPDVIFDSTGTMYVAWREVVGGATGNVIYVRKETAGGWVEVGVGSATGAGISGPGNHFNPTLAIDENDNPYVCWRGVNPAFGAVEAYVRKFDPVSATWVEVSPGSATGVGISSTATSSSDFARICSDGKGTFNVFWREFRPSFGGIEILGKRSNGGAFSEVDGSASGWGIFSDVVIDSQFLGNAACDRFGRPAVAVTRSTGFAKFMRVWDGPGFPASLAQQHLDSSPILTGAATSESFVKFSGLIQGSDGNDASLEVEFKPVGTPFDGIPTAASPMTPVGSMATATIPVIAGSYHWRARESSGSFRSGWVTFGGNPEASIDFSAGVAPAAPSAVDLTQHKLDGTLVAFGGTTTEGAIIFRWTPPAPLTEALRLQVSYAVGAPDAVADVESPLAPAGSVTPISISVPLALGAYDWQARVQNAAGLSSSFTPFNAGSPDFSVIAAPPPVSPAVPSLLTQTTTGAVSITPITGFTTEPMVVLGATLTGAPGDLIRLQFDVEAGALDATPDFESPLILMTGAPVVVTYTIPLGDGAYDWAVRAQGSTLGTSAWVPFAATTPDFNVDTPTSGPPPASPTIVGQFKLDGTTAITLTTGTTTESGAVFKGTVPASPDMLRLQLEVVPGGSPFSGIPTAESALVPGGTTVGISFPLGAGGWQWRMRTSNSAGMVSAWVEAVAGLPADLTVTPSGAAPTVPTSFVQRNLDLSVLPTGGTATASSVVLEAAVPVGVPLGKVQFEVTPAGSGHAGIPDIESAFVTGGTTVQVTLPLAAGSYHWQARTLTSTGLLSAFLEFVPGTGADFTIPSAGPVPVAPAVPSALFQLTAAGVSVPGGTTIAGNTVLFRGTVPGVASDLNRLQVEVVPSAGAFLGLPSFESPLLPGGTVVTITASLADNAYMWRARTFSSFDLASAWVDFGAPAGTDFSLAGAGLAPSIPSALDQQEPGGASIASGATAASDIVVFVGTVTGASGEPVRMQVEYTTGGFSGVPDVESPMVPSGSAVSISVPLAPGSYDWRARTINGTGAVSGYTALFGGSPDFVIAAAAAPVAPAAPAIGTFAQRNLDLTVIPTGGVATGTTVVLEAQVPLAVTLGRIQFELTPAGFGHSGNPDVESVLVAGGTTVQVSVPLAPGGYHWQARTQSSNGLSSAFVEFAAGTGADFTIATAPPAPVAPATPLPIDQQTVGGASVPATGTVAGDTIALVGTIPGAPTDLVRLQVEVIAAASAFTGIPTNESSLQAGGTLATILVSRPDGPYKWRARSFSSFNLASAWVDFSGAVGTDFVLSSVGLPPPVTAGLDQRNPDGSSIAGGGTAAGSVVVFVGTVTGASGEPVRLQVDFAATGGLSGVADVESPLVPSGSTIQISVPFANGSFEWQARTVNGAGAASAFTGFGGAGTDFVVTSGAPGAAPAAPLAAGMAQLNLDSSSIPVGGTAAGNVVIFEVTVPGAATDMNRIQVDVEAGALDGIPDVESALVPGGSTIQITVPFGVGSYDWAARTMSNAGLSSAFTPFNAASPDFVVAAAPGPVAPGAPVAGSMDQQNLDGSSIAASGGTALSNVVVFEVVVPGIPTDLNRIQVDVEATGALDGVPNFESPLVPGGTTVHIQASFGNGSYEWQARTESSMMADSGFTAFTGGPTDFIVAQGGPTPPVSAGLTQTNSDGSALASGATTTTNTVLFGGTVATTPAGGTARLQVEFAAPGGLTGNPSVESPLVPDGTTVSISVPLADGSYEWQARTMSSGGSASAFTPFAGGPADFVVAVGGGGVPPSVPTGLDQQNLDGSSIPAAGAATGSTVVFEAVVGGAPGSLDRLQVEFNPTGPGFSGVPDVESPLVLAGSTVHIAVPHTPGTFQWQARTQSSMGAVSAFVEYAAGGGTDYIVTSIAGGPAPAFPIALTQLMLDGVTGIPPGGTTTEPVVVFRATLPGAAVDLNRLQVEYLPAVAALFTGNPTVESPLVPGGTTISIVAPMADGSWQWRARSESSSTAVSTWVDFGGAAPGTDYIVNTVGVVPPAPAGLAQQNADGSSIAPGATAVTDVVRFGATVTSTTGEEVSLQVEFAPVGGLSGTPDVESPLVPTGSLVFITLPLGDGSYEWQARTKAASGAVSTYTPFGGSSGVTADFVVAAGAGGVPPGVPTGITQRRLDGTVIAAGGTTSGDTVVFEGTVSGPPASFLRLEVEFALFGTGLAGVPDVESPLVPTGSTVQIAASLGDGSYEWQARARTSTGAISAFSPAFGTSGVSADFVVAAGSGGVPPAPPSGIGQFRIDGISVIPAGGIVTDDKLIFRGTVAGLVTSLFRLQVEYVDSASVFTGNPTVESPLVPGSSLVSISVPVGDGNYMWRARSQSSTGASSGWIDFNLPAGTDFTIASSGLTPPVPGGLGQETLSGSTIPAGGTTFSDTVVFRGTVTNPGGLVKMQVEFASPSSLGGIPSVESPLVPSGTSVTIAVPLGDGAYEWQARAVSPTGLASAFVPFGGTTGVTDFIVSAGTGGPAPSVPSGLAQRRLDQSLISAGGTTSGDTVIFEALVSGAPASFVRLQVEYAISGAGLTGIPDVESVLVPTGAFVQIAVPLGDGNYEWQARTQSSLGAVSPFVEFNPVPAAIDFVVASGVGTLPPGPPTSLEQRTIAGALVPSGGTVTGDTIVFRGTVPAGPLFVRMQVEFVQLPTVFTGVPSVESPLVPGGSVVSITVPIADGVYGWQARAQTSTGGSSAFSDFGGPADVDFIIAAGGTPPPAPTGLAQLDSSALPIPIGGTTFTSTVQFQAVATGALPGDLVRLQANFAAPGSLSGSPDVESPFLPSGSTVTVSVPLGNGSYEWQVRTFGPGGAVSPWSEFVAGLATDFIVDAGSGVVPPAPAALDQLRVDGTSIPSGATVFADTVKFTGVVSTTDGSLAKLQVDFSPLSGVIDVESPFVPSGSTVEITVPLADGSYDWQARTASSTSALSPFVPFPGGSPDFIIDANQVTNPPVTPTVLGQQDPLGVAIPVGGPDTYDSVVLFATLPGLPTDLIRLQLEIKPVADVFTGTPDVESILLPGGSTALVTVPLGDGDYHWQARAQRSVGVSSAWVEFGGNPTASVDFNMNHLFPGFAPPAPSTLDQVDSNMQSIPLGSDVGDNDVYFQGVVTGDPAKMFKLQVEVRLVGEAFTGLVSYESMFLPTGSTAQIHAYLGSGPFHWQARTITSSNVVSPWISFGANAEDTADFEIRSPQDGVDHHVANSRKRHLLCGLTGFEFPALFGLWLLGRKVVRKARKGKLTK